MSYEPQTGDVICHPQKGQIRLTKVTAASAQLEGDGWKDTQPRELVDKMLAGTLKNPDVTVTRDGKIIHPVDQAPPAMAGSSGSHNAHARLAPSHSKTWTTCTLALAYCKVNAHRILPDTGSPYAAEGTEAHDHAADVLLGKKPLVGVPEDMREPVGSYVDHCLALVPDGVKPQVEVSVPLFYQPAEKGTCDFAVVTDERVIVRDYKHGAGVLVTSEGNTQLAIYAYSLIQLLSEVHDFTDDTVIDIKVVQPRHHMAEDDQPWVLPLSEFRTFCEDIAEKARIANDAVQAVEPTGQDTDPEAVIAVCPTEAEFVAQEGDEGSCRWCKAKAFCGIRNADALSIMPDLTPVPVKTLTLEQLIFAFTHRKKIEKFLSDVEKEVEYIASQQSLPGLKWVEGRQGNRSWANEEAAETFLKNQGLKMEERGNWKLKSPAQIEALLKDKLANTRTKNRFEELVTRSDGKPVLVPDDDKRPALPSPSDVMPNMEEEI